MQTQSKCRRPKGRCAHLRQRAVLAVEAKECGPVWDDVAKGQCGAHAASVLLCPAVPGCPALLALCVLALQLPPLPLLALSLFALPPLLHLPLSLLQGSALLARLPLELLVLAHLCLQAFLFHPPPLGSVHLLLVHGWISVVFFTAVILCRMVPGAVVVRTAPAPALAPSLALALAVASVL